MTRAIEDMAHAAALLAQVRAVEADAYQEAARLLDEIRGILATIQALLPVPMPRTVPPWRKDPPLTVELPRTAARK